MSHHHPLRHRVSDALLGLLNGSIKIGGTDAHGLYDNPVVMALYDAGFLTLVCGAPGTGGQWGLSLDGFEAAGHLMAVKQRWEHGETPR